jgi:hypothetical protein
MISISSKSLPDVLFPFKLTKMFYFFIYLFFFSVASFFQHIILYYVFYNFTENLCFSIKKKLYLDIIIIILFIV